MQRKILHVAVGALALFAAAAVTTPVFASCSQTDGQYEQPKAVKPLIELNQLNAAQLAELKAYAVALNEQVGAIATEADKAEEAAWAQKDKPKPTDDERAKTRQATSAKMVAVANRLGDTLSFRTTITVGNGMLCGAQIKVQLPPAPDNIEMIGARGNGIVYTWGEGRQGGREQGQFYTGYLLQHIEYEIKHP